MHWYYDDDNDDEVVIDAMMIVPWQFRLQQEQEQEQQCVDEHIIYNNSINIIYSNDIDVEYCVCEVGRFIYNNQSIMIGGFLLWSWSRR